MKFKYAICITPIIFEVFFFRSFEEEWSNEWDTRLFASSLFTSPHSPHVAQTRPHPMLNPYCSYWFRGFFVRKIAKEMNNDDSVCNWIIVTVRGKSRKGWCKIEILRHSSFKLFQCVDDTWKIIGEKWNTDRP